MREAAYPSRESTRRRPRPVEGDATLVEDSRERGYVWADGVHFNVRLGDERVCTLVLMGEGVDRGRGRLPRECGELEVGVAGSEAARCWNS
jgi:hypothetical protein